MGWWDWVGIGFGIIGLVAFVMAVQPFIQAFISPKLTFDFHEHQLPGAKTFRCTVRNLPLQNRAARILHLHRPQPLVRAVILVSEIGSNRRVAQYAPGWIFKRTELMGNEVIIPIDSPTASLNWAIKYEGEEVVDLVDAEFEEELEEINQALENGDPITGVFRHPLGRGLYTVELLLMSEGSVLAVGSTRLHVQGQRLQDAFLS